LTPANKYKNSQIRRKNSTSGNTGFAWCRTVLNMIRFPDSDPTGLCNSEPDPIGLDFEKNSTGSDMDIQTALITAVKCF